MRTSLKTHERTAQASDRGRRALRHLGESARRTRLVDVPRELVSFFISPYPDEVTVNMTRVTTSTRSIPTTSRVPRSRRGRRRCSCSASSGSACRALQTRGSRRRERRSAFASRAASSGGTRLRATTSSGAALRRRGRAQRLPDRHPQSVGQRHDDAARALRASLTRFRIAAWCRKAATAYWSRGAASPRRTRRSRPRASRRP